jgi:hypothetical protein
MNRARKHPDEKVMGGAAEALAAGELAWSAMLERLLDSHDRRRLPSAGGRGSLASTEGAT